MVTGEPHTIGCYTVSHGPLFHHWANIATVTSWDGCVTLWVMSATTASFSISSVVAAARQVAQWLICVQSSWVTSGKVPPWHTAPQPGHRALCGHAGLELGGLIAWKSVLCRVWEVKGITDCTNWCPLISWQHLLEMCLCVSYWHRWLWSSMW